MKITTVNAINASSEAIIYPIIQNDSLETHLRTISQQHGLQSELLLQDFKGDDGQMLLFYVENKRIFLLGLGKSLGEGGLISTFRTFFYNNKNKLPATIVIDLRNDYLCAMTESVVNGALLGGYDIELYKTDEKTTHFYNNADASIALIVTENSVESTTNAIQKAQATAQVQMAMMDLGNKPANHKYPKVLAQWALDEGQKHGFDVTVFDEKQCETIGFGALLAVGKGSEHPPRMIVMEYKHPNATKKIALVGKGVTFDTGGISIKPSTNMHLMKSDMGGAAAVLGTMSLVAQLSLPVHLYGIVPTTENSVDGLATKPGDVVRSYAGKTIEIIDTDAEGRLILADALTYINRTYQPDVIIDLATLTGSVIATLGYEAAGLFTNNNELAQTLAQIGEQTGEKLWRLPLWDDYKNELKSDIADVKNYHGKPFAGAIVAAKFLEVFVENHPSWAHLDIAGMAFKDSAFATQKSATAFGVRLLTRFLEKLG